MQQADDFRFETESLHALVAPLSDAQLLAPTRFKSWSIEAIIGHLHMWNVAARLSLTDAAAFRNFLKQAAPAIASGGLLAFEAHWRGSLAGKELVAAWLAQARALANAALPMDPSARIHWVGPDMSVRSNLTARLMETWAHGQAIWDRLGKQRIDDDRIGNIVRLGINTFGWTFANRGLEVPPQMPQLLLRAPSGTEWQYGEPSDAGLIQGSATAFCQVVTQTRNIADTDLQVTGAVAQQWMSIAQCFAGPPQDPPLPGSRIIDDSPL